MRLLFILAASVVVAGGAIAMYKVPNIRGVERVLALYQADPQGTSGKLEAAVLHCLPETNESQFGRSMAKKVIVPFIVRVLHLRKEESSAEAVSARMKKWFTEDRSDLWNKLPDRDFLQLVAYLKQVGDDNVENCILHKASFGEDVSELDSKAWELRG